MPSLTERMISYTSALSFKDSILFDVFCALAAHGAYHKYEVEPANISVTVLLLLGVPAIPCYILSASVESLAVAFAISYLLFYCTLVVSITMYRVSPMHPLATYPGPLSLRMSKLVGAYHASGGKQHIFLRRLHDRYGPFVRVGPNELSIADADAIAPVLGGMRKGPMWASQSVPGTPPIVVAIRDVEEHAKRRRLWNHGFTTASLKDFQPSVESRINEFVEELGKRVSIKSGQNKITVDFSEWLASLIFDVMGDLVFGGGFGFINSGGKCEIRSVIEDNMRIVSILGHIPWILGIIHKVAIIPEGQRRFLEFASERYDMRKAKGSTRKDLFHYITNEEGLETMEVSRAQGLNDVLGAITAGSDTTSTVLSGLFYHLFSNRVAFDRLRVEVDSEFPPGEGEPFDTSKLAKMPYLNAVINEALRLQPPAATGLQRCPMEGSGGSFVKGRFIPENASVYIAPYVIHRDSRYFSPYPDSFIPERWLSTGDGKFTTNLSAFIPFSVGFANCVGKNLALMEMRMVVAAIVQRFDIEFAEGYDPTRWEEDLQDFLAMRVGELPVVLHARG